MNLSAYLDRISYSGPRLPTLAVLRELQIAHLLSVPFENLDIHLGRAIQLDEASLFDKIVTRRRGGFCYELNGLFSRALDQLGYSVTLLNARGINDDSGYSREFDHLALQVRVPGSADETWLVDVGWGNGPRQPVKLVEDVEQAQGERTFKLARRGDYLELLERRAAEESWTGHYAFTLTPRAYADFFDCCAYHQTSPESMFTQKRLCTLYLADGAVTLSELRLITTRGGVREERMLRDEAEARATLRQIFGVDIARVAAA